MTGENPFGKKQFGGWLLKGLDVARDATLPLQALQIFNWWEPVEEMFKEATAPGGLTGRFSYKGEGHWGPFHFAPRPSSMGVTEPDIADVFSQKGIPHIRHWGLGGVTVEAGDMGRADDALKDAGLSLSDRGQVRNCS